MKQEHADQLLAHLMFFGAGLYLLGRAAASEGEEWTEGIMRLLTPLEPVPAPPAPVTVKAVSIPLECRACGAGPEYFHGWGGLIPIEHVIHEDRDGAGSHGVFVCRNCYPELEAEVRGFFRKTLPAPAPLTPPNDWFGYWL